MSSMNDWQVFIEYRPDLISTFVYVRRKVADSRHEFLTKGGTEAVVQDLTTAIVKEDLFFARVEDDYILSLIVEALDKRGVQAPAQSFIQGKLEATEAHLQDMRKLVPKLVKEAKQ